MYARVRIEHWLLGLPISGVVSSVWGVSPFPDTSQATMAPRSSQASPRSDRKPWFHIAINQLAHDNLVRIQGVICHPTDKGLMALENALRQNLMNF